MPDETVGGVDAAIAEFQSLMSNGGDLDVKSFVALHNRSTPEVRTALRFIAQVQTLQQLRRLDDEVCDLKHNLRKLRSDTDASRLSVSGALAAAGLAVATVGGVQPIEAVAAGMGAAIIGYFVQLALAALLYRRENM